MRKRRRPARPPDSAIATTKSSLLVESARTKADGIPEAAILSTVSDSRQPDAKIASRPVLYLHEDLASLLVSRAKKSLSNLCLTDNPAVLHTLVSAQQIAATGQPLFVYDRAATTDLLQWCHARQPENVAVVFVPAGKHFPWNHLLKGIKLLTQLTKARCLVYNLMENK